MPLGEMTWVPNSDAYIANKHLIIQVELAGMRQSDLELTVHGNRLSISGQRRNDNRAAKCKFLVMEVNFGPFECVFEIPAGFDITQAKASYQNGFLNIEIPEVVQTPAKNLCIPVTEG